MGTVNPEVFDQYFRSADLDGDGLISGSEAVAFFQGANLPQTTLAKIWQFADNGRMGSLSRTDFYNALKLVTVAQTGRELTYALVSAALSGTAASQIPPPKIVMRPTAPGSLAPQSQGAPPPRYGVTLAHQGNTAVRPVKAPVRTLSGISAQDAGPGNYGPGPPRPSGAGLPMFTTDGHRPSAFGADSWKPPSSAPPTATGGGPGSQILGTRNSGNAPSPQGKPAAPAGSSADAFQGVGFKLTPQSSTGSHDSSFGLDTNTVGAAKPAASSAQQQLPIDPGLFEDSTFQATSLPLVPTIVDPQQATPTPVTPAITRAPDGNAAFTTAVAAAPSSVGPWPKMTQADKLRYSKVFAEVDTDRDGKITGSEARDLFLSWQLPIPVLKQVWDLSDQDGDYMLSLSEFRTALYLLDRYREGRPLVLPPGFDVDDEPHNEWESVAAARIAEANDAMAKHSAGYNVPIWQQVPELLQPSRAGAPAAAAGAPDYLVAPQPPSVVGSDTGTTDKYKSKVPVLEPHLVAQLNRDEQEMLKSKHRDAEGAEKKVYELDKDIMDSKEKVEFYKSKLQEIIIFKTRCDNRLAEVTERSSAEKREAENLSRRYEDKFKQTGESNSRLQAEEAVFREVQHRKMDLYNAIAKMDQGADGNVLLQSQANRISDDLDELRKAFNERAKRLGLKIKAAVATELPFGWQPGLQESAAEWDEDWDKFEDDGFTPVEDVVSSETGEEVSQDDVPQPKMTPSNSREPINWNDADFFDDGFEFPSDTKLQENGAHVTPVAKLSSPPASVQAESEDGSPKSVAESTLFSNKHFDGEPVEKEVVESVTPRAVDALGGSPLDIRAVPTDFSRDTRAAPSDSFSGPLGGDNGNGHATSHDFGSFTSFGSSKDLAADSSGIFTSSASGIFGGPSLFADSPKSYARTDTSRETLVRFDSFSSVRDTPRRKFESFDEDPFAGTGPFSASTGQGGRATKTSLDWSAF